MTGTMAYCGEDFCLVHGRDHMRSYMGNPIPFCAECETDKSDKIEVVRTSLFTGAIKAMTRAQRQDLAGKVYRFICERDPFGDQFSAREADIVRELIQFH